MNDERDAGPSMNGGPQGSSPMGGQPGPGQFPQQQWQQVPPGGYPGAQQQWQPQPPPKKNWFLRHKILTGLLGLAVLVGLGTAMGGGSKKSDTSGSAASAPASASGKASSSASSGGSGSSEQGPAPVGTPVRDGKFEFTVTKVERNQKSVGEQYAQQTAQGEYTLVHVTVKNIGDAQQSLSDNDQKAFDADGTQYSADSTADAMIQNNQVLFNEINPGNQIKGVLVFDAPAGKKLTKIEFHDSMFSGGVKAAL